jgi:tetratricopeptide (TPR) repeat protein
MRQLIKRLRKELEEFVEQRDDLILIAACSPEESATVVHLLRDLEQSGGSDVFLLFADDFFQAGPFVSVAIERLRIDHRLASEALKQEGRQPLPPMPEILLDATRPPAQRLQDAVGFAVSLLPPAGGHRLVWGMFPQNVADRHEYLKLVAQLAPWNGVKPWMRGARLLFRDEPDTPEFAPGLASAPKVRLRRLDAGPGAVERSLRADAENEALPNEDRMQALFLMASLDYAHCRYQEAADKYNLLLGYYQSTGNHAMQAYVINGIGDIFQRGGDFERAQHWYECAIDPATRSEQPVVLATVVRNLGEVAYARRLYPEAEQYFDGWDKLAGEMLDPDSKAQALEKRGLSQQQQGALDKAVDSWQAAATLSRNVGMSSRLRANLTHLERGYQYLGMADSIEAVRTELQAIAGQEDPR